MIIERWELKIMIMQMKHISYYVYIILLRLISYKNVFEN